jgi:diguanylate cyclase (GGDEF)-like protein
LALDGDTAQLAVTACVVVLALAMAVAAALLALRGLQRIERRIQHVTDIARTVLTGDVLLLDEEEEPLDDPIGKLEGDLRSIAGALAERDAALQEEAFRQRFDGTVQRAMTMAQTELDVAELTRRTLETALPERASEVLIADASDAGLRVATGSAERPCCPVTSPQACFAVRRGQAIHFPNAQALDACPKLQGRERPADAAICVPVPVMGKTVGVLHATTPASRPFADGEIVGLESLVRHLGARLGMIRALETSRMQAETDALTGLLNRRSLAGRCQELFTSGTPVAMVVCDLDHFKHLNDTHGHDAGDCALRLFAQVVRKSVRPTDLVGRYGGEEFVLALPGAEPEQAVAVLQRVREALRDALAQGGGPSFTCSFGVAVYPVHGSTLHDLVKAADTALYRAKTNGRDRVEVAGRTEPLSTVQAA